MLNLYIKYIKNIIINPAALIIILGLSLIPSFYTWITLKANWNPYVYTKNIPIAIVNEDYGTILNNEIINYGDQIVQSLQNNTDMNWIFVGEKVANQALKTGDYYAEIIIPKDFSDNLQTVFTGSPIKPTITYIINEKSNAIATKISNLATDQLIDKIKQIFLKNINETLLTQSNKLGHNLLQNKPMLIDLKNILSNIAQNITNIQNNINSDNFSLNDLNNYLNSLKNNSDSMENSFNSLKNIPTISTNLLNSLKNSLNNLNENIKNSISQIKDLENNNTTLLNQLKNTKNQKQISVLANRIINNNNDLTQVLGNILTSLKNINTTYPSVDFNDPINSINNITNFINTETNSLNQLNNSSSINTNLKEIENIRNNLSKDINILENSLSFNWINQIIDTINNQLNNINEVTNNINSIIPQVNLLQNISNSISLNTISKTEELNLKLKNFKSSINSLKINTDKITSSTLNNLISLLEKDPNVFSSYFSSPINIKIEELYGMSVFGIGLAPFYTVLSIWVGALLCTSLLTTSDEEAENGTKKRILQIHFAKMILFLTINIIQTLIVTLGNILLLSIYPANLKLLILFSLLTSVTFTLIVFTLVSLTGNIGKASAIIIMVTQVAGSGAIYPIQVTPEIFQRLQFIWPFTYAIDGFRQSIGGPDLYNVYRDITALIIFIIIFLILAIGKTFIYKISKTTENLFKETGL